MEIISKHTSNIFLKIASINDSNQKVALGAGLGAFFGIIPGAGPIVSLSFAVFLRLNKLATLLGCLLTNTWITFILAVPASKIGAYLLKLDWLKVYEDLKSALKTFRLADIFNVTFLKLLAPILLGYLIIAFIFGFVIYCIILFLLIKYRRIPLK